MHDLRLGRLGVGRRQRQRGGARRRPRGGAQVVEAAVRADERERAQRHARRRRRLQQLQRGWRAEAVREHVHGREPERAAHGLELRRARLDAAHRGGHVASRARKRDLDDSTVAHRRHLEVLQVVEANARVADQQHGRHARVGLAQLVADDAAEDLALVALPLKRHGRLVPVDLRRGGAARVSLWGTAAAVGRSCVGLKRAVLTKNAHDGTCSPHHATAGGRGESRSPCEVPLAAWQRGRPLKPTCEPSFCNGEYSDGL